MYRTKGDSQSHSHPHAQSGESTQQFAVHPLPQFKATLLCHKLDKWSRRYNDRRKGKENTSNNTVKIDSRPAIPLGGLEGETNPTA